MEFRCLLGDPNEGLAIKVYVCTRGDDLGLIMGCNWKCRVCSECLMSEEI